MSDRFHPPIPSQEPCWQDDLLCSDLGQILPWEFNIDLILRNDPHFLPALLLAARQLERATIQSMLLLQHRYKLRVDYHTLNIIVKILAEDASRRSVSAALAT